MGLDSVELVLATEEEFGITIDDDDAGSLTTPQEVADYVISRLGTPEVSPNRCLSQAGFYRIRSTLVNQFGARRGEIRPNARIQDFLTGDIRKQWHALVKNIAGHYIPSLECRKSLLYPLTIGMPLMGAGASLYCGMPVWPAIFLIPFVLLLFALSIAIKLADIIPENMTTVGALAPYVSFKDQGVWNRRYVLQRVVQITATQLGIAIEKIHPNHRFVEDLGMDQ